MYTWKEKLADWWAGVKERWNSSPNKMRYIAIYASIGVIILAIALGSIALKVGDLREQVDQFGNNLSDLEAHLQTGYDDLEKDVAKEMGSQWQALETNLDQFSDQLAAMAAALNVSDLEAHLQGSYGNYVLQVTSQAGGNFTANVHLAYSPAVGNTTDYAAALNYFYTGVNFTEGGPSFVCLPVFNGSGWSIADVWYNVGVFDLLPDEQVQLPVSCVGLNTTWLPDFAYVEVFRCVG